LVDYLTQYRRGERFLAATVNANSAAPLILATGEPVMALGGFSGGDRILAPQQLAQRVAAGDVRFFLLPTTAQGPASQPGQPGPQNQQGQPIQPAQQSQLLRWVESRCTPVPAAEWRTPGPTPPGGEVRLWDCRA
jgi:4-amino-4-deoxy-L-arabinose transferase-like glycosyltransferase